MNRATTFLLVIMAVVACTSHGPSDAELETRLLEAGDLSATWTSADELATELGGGFCELDEVVQGTDPGSEAAATFVSGEVMLRQSLLGYPAETDAADARATIEQELIDCSASNAARDLGIVVSEPASWSSDTSRLRLEVEVAGVPLALGFAIWQQDDVVGVLRLTYPSGALEDPLAAHEDVTTTAQAKLADP